MTLVDKQIIDRVNQGQLIIENYSQKNVNCVSYDLTIDFFVTENQDKRKVLAPSEIVMVRTKEKLKIPYDLLGVIGEKNSRMRQGLVVSGPRYFPGHETYAFLRIQNVSSNVIELEHGNKIAQIFFEKLDDIPNQPTIRCSR